MTAALFFVIQRQGVLGMSARQGLRERVLAFRHGDNMNVIIHQAIAQNLQAVPDGLPAKKAEIETAICIRIKYRLAIVTPLCDMVGNAGNDNAWATGHIANKCPAGPFLLKN